MIIGTLTLIGQQRIRKQIADYDTHPIYIAYGMCATTDTALETNTGLVNEHGRKIATVSVSGDELTMAISRTISTAQEVMEVGIFTGPSKTDPMIYRGLLSEDSTTPKSRWLNVGDMIDVSIVFDFANGVFVET